MAQQPDFWQQIAENVDVHRSDIDHVATNSLVLKDGTSVTADAILCGTGFNRSFTLFEGPTAADLGLPVPKGTAQKDGIHWTALEKAADDEIVSQFPALTNPPYRRESNTTPYRLYNLITPIIDDSVVFLGYLGVLNAFYTAECQAIWATAHLDKNIKLPSREERIKDTAQINAFSKRRYPFLGYDGAAVNYDMIGYCERLLSQVGLKSHVPSGWWDYWFGVCNASTLTRTTEEYLKLHGESSKSDSS
jgi:hypothetical protein